MATRWREWARGRRGGTTVARRGQAITEMALLTPFFLLILLGALDLGRIYIAQNRLNSAVKEAAMLGLYQPDPATVAGRAFQEVTDPYTGRQYLGVPSVDFVIDVVECYSPADVVKSCGNPAPGDYIVVTGYHVFQPITSEIMRFLPANQRIWKTVRAAY